MKKISFYLLFCFVCYSYSCQQQPPEMQKTDSNSNPMAEHMSVARFAQRLTNTQGALLLDVRTPAEVAETGKIERATVLNYEDEPNFNGLIAALDKNTPVMLYCASGVRSGKALLRLQALGFTNTCDLEGGMMAWQAKGMPTVK